MTYEQTVTGKDGEQIRVGDLVTDDGYWAYKVDDMVNNDLFLAEGPARSASRFSRVDPAMVDTQGRIVSEKTER